MLPQRGSVSAGSLLGGVQFESFNAVTKFTKFVFPWNDWSVASAFFNL